jgi:hypothetical protein
MKDSFNLKDPKNIFYLVVICVAMITAMVLLVRYKAVLASRQNVDSYASSDLKPREEKVIVTMNVETLEDGLENMGVLVTQEYYFTQVETYTKEKKILNFIDSTSQFTYSYDGKVTAGVDFGDIDVTKDEENKTITVEIPYSKLQSTDIDTGSFKVYSENDSLWNPIKLEDYNLSLAEFEETAERKALESGILERSNDQAEALIKNFIMNFPGTGDYSIEFVQRRNTNES